MTAPLLAGEEEGARVLNEKGASPILLVCEHAGRRIPRSLGTLGLEEVDLRRHIAWDIGAEEVARRLSHLLDAALVVQRYSRLVYDCNRPPQSSTAIPEISETTRIPGNEHLSPEDREVRTRSIYIPFHARVKELLDGQQRLGRPVIFVTIHSFTRFFKGVERKLDAGLLFDKDRRLSDALLPLLRAEGLDVRANEPYGPEDGVCHTINLHAGARGIPYSMIEIRNDLVASEAGQTEWAERLSKVLQSGVLRLGTGSEKAGLKARA